MTHEEKWLNAQVAKCREVNPSATIVWREMGELPKGGSYAGYYILWEDSGIYSNWNDSQYVGIGDAKTAVLIVVWIQKQKHERGWDGKKSGAG